MPYSKEKVNVMNHLGMGLSVDNLCKACEITYNDLCTLAQDHPDLYHELKKWYKRFDFVPQYTDTEDVPAPEGVEFEHEEELKQDKSLETKENTEVKPKKAKKKVETK